MKIELKIIGPNQTEVRIGERVLFFSYNTLVAYRPGFGICYRADPKTVEKWSKTTTKHVNGWCHDRAVEVSHFQLLEMVNG